MGFIANCSTAFEAVAFISSVFTLVTAKSVFTNPSEIPVMHIVPSDFCRNASEIVRTEFLVPAYPSNGYYFFYNLISILNDTFSDSAQRRLCNSQVRSDE